MAGKPSTLKNLRICLFPTETCRDGDRYRAAQVLISFCGHLLTPCLCLPENKYGGRIFFGIMFLLGQDLVKHYHANQGEDCGSIYPVLLLRTLFPRSSGLLEEILCGDKFA